ncbi:hypothetical protein Solca_2422 [Solitalea canadensis DSM 3403]|uniref:Uncharacterized protein n=2 Tax=Solitalea canadensis TaxID=995 RepID=H8KRD8_SOLCM|nr:hypothetical protein Solca_2422 [Solitalea canadensis DSM 3403]
MMSKILCFVMTLLSLNIYAQQRYVIISGQFSNTKPGTFLIIDRDSYFGKEPIRDSICLHDDGHFEDTLKTVHEATLARFSISNEPAWQNTNIRSFLFPDYSLYMTGDVQKGLTNTLKYYNCGSIVNNYLLEREKRFTFDIEDFTIIKPYNERQKPFMKENRRIQMYNLNYTQAVLLPEASFDDSVFRYYDRRKEYARSYFMENIDPGDISIRYFDMMEKVDCRFSKALVLLKYPTQNALITHELEMPWSDINVHYYKQFEEKSLQPSDACLPIQNYRNYFVQYINLLSGDFVEIVNVNPKLASFTERFKIALNTYEGKTRDLVLASILEDKFKDVIEYEDENNEAEKLVEEFRKIKPDVVILRQVEKLYTETLDKINLKAHK